ncbi:hypothetical protein PPL_11040 [Heterostelium album PN500]|uniref:Uncharacterized protein n=1 Tax=Heterostelium pallidum (strain ATCC 26659 / Pp 5 / PN500) TaxID=670386 RepID=D3BSS0_HETP5|nr:hypothetical protein PPL_11040 [Heterostelium album PN500]EFA75535.1 hypothetical protein PPL_11040 [Heterostelium album PN500]|eukprot:XP_020427669.1 hypothetical protein PPL_11040 [Heterostelium album PN500]
MSDDIQFTPNIVYGISPTLPRLNIAITSTVGVSKGYIQMCGTEFDFGPDAVTSDSLNSYVNLCISIPTTVMKACKDTGQTAASSLVTMIRLQNDLFVSSTIVPKTSLGSTFVYDTTAPVISNVTVSSSTDTIYVKFKAKDASSDVDYCYVNLMNGNGAFIFYAESMPSSDQFYSASNSPSYPSTTFYVTSVTCADIYSNLATYSLSQKVVINLPGPTVGTFNESSISYSFSPNTITGSNVTKQNTIKYTVTYQQPTKPFLTFTALMAGNPCNIIYTSKTTFNIYCIIDPYTISGSYFPSISYSFVGLNGQIGLSTNGTVQITNDYVANYQINQLSFNVANWLGKPPVTIQMNMTFIGGGVPISEVKLSTLLTMNQENLVEGTLSAGTLSTLFVFDPSLGYSLNTTNFNFKSPSNTQVVSKNGILTASSGVYPVPIFKNVYPFTNGLDLTDPFPQPYYGIYSTYQTDSTYITTPSIADFIDFTPFSMNSKSLVSGFINNGQYQTTIDPKTINSISSLWGVNYLSGSYNLNFRTSNGWTSISNTMYSSCIQIQIPKRYIPTVSLFDYNPKILESSTAMQIVIFSFILEKNLDVGIFDQVFIKFSKDSYQNQIATPCVVYTDVGNSASYRCNKLVPPGTNTNDYTISIIVSYINGFSHTIPTSYLIVNSFPATIRFIGQNPMDNFIQPTISKLSIDSQKKILSFKIEAQSSYLTFVGITIQNGYMSTAKPFSLYSYSSWENPSQIVQSNVSLDMVCNQQSLKSLQSPVVTLTIKDFNGQIYSYSNTQIKELFPTFNIDPIVCTDAFPPRVDTFTIINNSNENVTAFTFEIRITDNLVGFKNMTIQLSSNSVLVEKYLVNSTHRISGDENNGLYRLSLQFPLQSQTVLQITIPHLYDNHENDRPYLEQDMILLQASELSLLSVSLITPPELVSSSSPNVILGGAWILIANITGDVYRVVVDVTDYNGVIRKEMVYSQSSGIFSLSYYPIYVGKHYYSIMAIGKDLITYTLTGTNSNLPSFTVTSNGFTNSLPIFAQLKSDISNTYLPKATITMFYFFPTVGHKLRCALIDSNNQIINGSYVVPTTTINSYTCTVPLAHVYGGLQAFYWSLYFEHSGTGRSVFLNKLDLPVLGMISVQSFDFNNPTTTTTTTGSSITTQSSTTSTATATTTQSSTTGVPINDSNLLVSRGFSNCFCCCNLYCFIKLI